MNIEELINKYEVLKHEGVGDLSSDQDLSIAVMNLISIEEHLFFSGAKTENTKYYDLIEEIREMRKMLLRQLIPSYEGEVWCLSKHLLAASYRLMEVGNKLLHQQNKEVAYGYFEQAFKLYSLFWGLNLETVTNEEASLAARELGQSPLTPESAAVISVPYTSKGDKVLTKKKDQLSLLDRAKMWVKKALDCCRE